MFLNPQKKSQPSLLTMGKLPPSELGLRIGSGVALDTSPIDSTTDILLPRGYNAYEYETDGFRSSGMCKAGFAGDDAPRAVFRKYFLLQNNLQSRNLSASSKCNAAFSKVLEANITI